MENRMKSCYFEANLGLCQFSPKTSTLNMLTLFRAYFKGLPETSERMYMEHINYDSIHFSFLKTSNKETDTPHIQTQDRKSYTLTWWLMEMECRVSKQSEVCPKTVS